MPSAVIVFSVSILKNLINMWHVKVQEVIKNNNELWRRGKSIKSNQIKIASTEA
jgi:hypothetical protein